MLHVSCGICFDCCLCNLVLYVTVEILEAKKSMVKQKQTITLHVKIGVQPLKITDLKTYPLFVCLNCIFLKKSFLDQCSYLRNCFYTTAVNFLVKIP